jgi:hypothetical protein
MIDKICIGCGKVFQNRNKIQKYCSMSCRTKSTKVIVTCAQCKKVFEDQRSAHTKYCSISCALTARNLTDANPSFHRDITGANNPMYGSDQKGNKNGMFGKTGENCSRWKGGKKIRKDGYILNYVPGGHPHAIDGFYVLQHRLVMEKFIGRYLTPAEVVHHIDGNPSNNAIENLRLYNSQSEHISDAHGFTSSGNITLLS